MLYTNKASNISFKLKLINLFFSVCLCAPVSYSIADVYLGFSAQPVRIKSDVASLTAHNALARIGYAIGHHGIELSYSTSYSNATLNQLTMETPRITSLFYRYDTQPLHRFRGFFILGSSSIDIVSAYPGITNTKESFSGFSYGFGLEEAFRSIPNLKLTFDYQKLYSGDNLDVGAFSLGARYVF